MAIDKMDSSHQIMQMDSGGLSMLKDIGDSFVFDYS